MSATSLDLSANTELRGVADLARSILDATRSERLFVVGAMARELILVHGYGIRRDRATLDLDFAIHVESWSEYESIRAHLIEQADFEVIPRVTHRLRSPEGMVVDLLPYGAVESRDRTIAWPPDGSRVMSMLGFTEAANATIQVTLPGHVNIKVAEPAGQALLKIIAWSDRRNQRAGNDAYDLTLLLRNYLELGNEERLYGEGADLLAEPNFDREVAGATLLGRDIAALLDDDSMTAVENILVSELDPDGKLRLAGDLNCEADKALGLLAGLARGLGVTGKDCVR